MKFTIITVVYNRVNSIEKTILSVLTQAYENYDYIIIDGGSNDGTCEIIEKYKSKLKYYVSEKDNGIYDAMNKGIKNVSDNESFILFLNSDDFFLNDQILNKISHIDNNYEFIYGKVLYKHNLKNLDVVLGNPETYQTLYRGMIQHQSCFVKKKLFDKIGYFDTSFKIAADFDFSIRILKYKFNIHFVDEIVSVMNMGGIGSSNYFKMYNEKLKIIYNHYDFSIYIIECFKTYFINIPKALVSNVIHKVLYKNK
jgi:glycosyltransferase involved in cell wall biosynthesis